LVQTALSARRVVEQAVGSSSGWTADRQLALFERATPNAINDSRVTVGVGGANRAVLIDW
jgi:hypothetical protein